MISPLKERVLVEHCLPAHQFALMAEHGAREGWELRADIVRYLNNAAVAPLKGLAPGDVQRVARQVDELAHALMRDTSLNDPRYGFMCCSLFTLRLVDEKLFPDARNQAVLVSLLMVEEAKVDSY